MKLLTVLFACLLLLIPYCVAAPITDDYSYEELSPDNLGDDESGREDRSESVSYEEDYDGSGNGEERQKPALEELLQDIDGLQNGYNNQELLDTFYTAGKFVLNPLEFLRNFFAWVISIDLLSAI